MSPELASLEVVSLVALYGVVPALRNVSMRVERGQVVTLLGANGAGKSTLMKCVSGLLRPHSGNVRLFGQEVTRMEPNDLVTRRLAMVPEGRRLFGPMTVQENLEIGAYAHRDRRHVVRYMERCMALFPDLKGKLTAPAGTLSGGQLQMVAVARALMSAPQILLLDEPTIGLAPALVDQIARVIKDIRKDGVDVLLVEQNAEMALAISDYGYVLESGSVATHGSASDLMNDDHVRRAYMGM